MESERARCPDPIPLIDPVWRVATSEERYVTITKKLYWAVYCSPEYSGNVESAVRPEKPHRSGFSSSRTPPVLNLHQQIRRAIGGVSDHPFPSIRRTESIKARMMYGAQLYSNMALFWWTTTTLIDGISARRRDLFYQAVLSSISFSTAIVSNLGAFFKTGHWKVKSVFNYVRRRELNLGILGLAQVDVVRE